MMLKNKSYVYLRFITLTLLLIGGLAWGVTGATGTNPISRVARALNLPYLSRVIYSMIGISAVLFLLKFYNRDTFLPFLGKTIFPPSLLNLGNPVDYDQEATLVAPAGAKYIVYWAAQSYDEVGIGKQTKKEAYGGYLNSGAVQVDPDGKAMIRFRNPVSYQIGKKVLKEHIHYRWLDEKGIMSRVHTLFL